MRDSSLGFSVLGLGYEGLEFRDATFGFRN